MKKVSRKFLMAFAERYRVRDITYASDQELETIYHQHLHVVYYSSTNAGVNARIYQDDEGRLYAVTKRTTAIYYLPFY